MRKKRNSTGTVVLIASILIVVLLAYLYNSKMFERDMPIIELDKKINWNLKKPIPIKISDESGLRFIRAVLSDGENSIVLAKKVFSVAENEHILNIEFPKTGFVSNKKSFEMTIEAVDSSKWSFFSGNKAVAKTTILVDSKRPELFIVNNSYAIIKGGIGTVVFKAKDENLKELYIETSFGKTFYPTPFYKDGYFISLLAWPRQEESFKATIVAHDKAGNVAKSRVRFFLKEKKFRSSRIVLKDRLLDGKIADLVQEDNPANLASMSKIEKFKHVNEDMRKRNSKEISEATSIVPKEMISSFSIKPFYPLKNGAAVAGFGDHRSFMHGEKIVSKSYHMGLDLASTARADIVVSNPGEVVYSKYNGIYGNTVIISHGLGVFSLYSHNSSNLVEEGELVKAGDAIAKTGVTGLALGDHLHFSMIVQGVEVRPEEWMDKSWMRDNIFDIIDSAKKIIDEE